MEISLNTTSLTELETDCLVIGVSEDDSVEGRAKELDTLIADCLDSGDFKPKSGSQITLRKPQGLKAKRIVLLGLGKADAFDALAQNDAFVGLGKTLKGLPITEATLDLTSLTQGHAGTLERLGYGLQWASYDSPPPLGSSGS